MTPDLPFPDLGGLCADMDLVLAVAAEPAASARFTSLLRHEGWNVAAEASTPEELLESCGRTVPHLAVLDWEACGPGPSAAVRRVRHDLPRTRIVVVLGGDGGHRDDVVAALDSGAEGIVLASRLGATLGATVRCVCRGQACVPRELRRHLERPTLSPREKQVLGMVATGFTNAEIAHRLYLAEGTVKGHLSSAFSKLGIHSRHEATALVRDPHARLGIGIVALPQPPHPASNGASR
jgi:DNA-binding NarL/FixJ family response regulator